MTRKIARGGILGGLALYAWGMVSHMALGLTDSSFRSLPNEAAIVQSLRDTLQAPALYLFPAPGLKAPKDQQEAAMKAWADAYARGPRGLLIYEPGGGSPSMARLFVTQLLIDLVVGITAAWVLALAAPAVPLFGTRVCLVAALGFLASVFVDLPYWNWYSFPSNYTLAALADRTIGMTVAGLVMARLVRA